jgi:hypothetical protein
MKKQTWRLSRGRQLRQPAYRKAMRKAALSSSAAQIATSSSKRQCGPNASGSAITIRPWGTYPPSAGVNCS